MMVVRCSHAIWRWFLFQTWGFKTFTFFQWKCQWRMCRGEYCGGIHKRPGRSPKGILSAVTKQNFFSYHFFFFFPPIRNHVLEEREQLFNWVAFTSGTCERARPLYVMSHKSIAVSGWSITFHWSDSGRQNGASSVKCFYCLFFLCFFSWKFSIPYALFHIKSM